IMKSAEKMRLITQHVERSSLEQTKGSRQISSSVENIGKMVENLRHAQELQQKGSEGAVEAAARIQELTREYQRQLEILRETARLASGNR
ncbi:MAG: chemotaxis protein, partial [Myxococcales bacterium]|nr:chemotaxis protein [Myxococcales bacterium]